MGPSDPKRPRPTVTSEPVISDPSAPGGAKRGAVPERPSAGDVEITAVQDKPEDVVPTGEAEVPPPQEEAAPPQEEAVPPQAEQLPKKRPREEDGPEPSEAPPSKQARPEPEPKKEEAPQPPEDPRIAEMQGQIQTLLAARDKEKSVQLATVTAQRDAFENQLADERARTSEDEDIPMARPATTRERTQMEPISTIVSPPQHDPTVRKGEPTEESLRMEAAQVPFESGRQREPQPEAPQAEAEEPQPFDIDTAMEEYGNILAATQILADVVDPMKDIELNQVNIEAVTGGMLQRLSELTDQKNSMTDTLQGLLEYAIDKAKIPEISQIISGYPANSEISVDQLEDLINVVNHQIKGSEYYIAEQAALKAARKRSATAPGSAVPPAKRARPSPQPTSVIVPQPAAVLPQPQPSATSSIVPQPAAVLPQPQPSASQPAVSSETGLPPEPSAADMLALLKGKATARAEKKAREDEEARAKMAKLKAPAEPEPEPTVAPQPSDPAEEARVAKAAIAEMKAALGTRPTPVVDKPLLGASAQKLTVRQGQVGTINKPKRRRDTQAFSFPTHAETMAKKARTAPRTDAEKEESLAQRIVQIQKETARTEEEKEVARKEQIAQVLSNEPDAPPINETQADMHRIKIDVEQKALETAQKEEEEAIRLQQEQEERDRQAQEAELTAQRARDTAATAVSSLPPALMTREDYAERRARLADEAVAREIAKYGPMTTTPITAAQRTALDEQFNLGRFPSAEEQATSKAKRGAVIPLTQSELAAQEDRRRKREQLSRTESDVREAKRRRTDLAPGLERAGATVRQRGEDVEMGRGRVAGAQQRATDARRRDEIDVWKSSSPLDEASRSVPSALQDVPELSRIATERNSLWGKALAVGGGASLTSSNKEFDKWLSSKGATKVLNKAKSVYQGVIGDFQPRTDSGKKLKAIAARRIVDIDEQIRKIDVGRVQKSRLSRSGRSKSPARRKSRSRSRSPQVGKADADTPDKKKKVGRGLPKRRRKSKIVKVNKDPPSTSRYFI